MKTRFHTESDARTAGSRSTRRAALRPLGTGLVGMAAIGADVRWGRTQDAESEGQGVGGSGVAPAVSPAAAPTEEGTMRRDLVVTRVVEAPVERVWRAWSDPEQVMRWWGPENFTSPRCRMDFREGGTTLVCMSSPDYGELYHTGTYRRIAPSRMIEFVQRPADKDGRPVDPAAAGMPPGVPPEVPHVVVLAAVGEGTTALTVTEFGYTSEQTVEISRLGMEQCLDKMAASLAET